MNPIIAFGLIAALVGLPAQAEERRLDFKGIQLGAHEAAFKGNPRFDCKSGESVKSFTDTYCFAGQEKTIAGARAKLVTLKFYEEKLGQITVKFDTAAFRTVSAALVEKYGQPTSDQSEIVPPQRVASLLGTISVPGYEHRLIVGTSDVPA